MTIEDRIRDHLHTQADRLPTETAPVPELPRSPRPRTALAAAAVVTAVVLLAIGIGQMILPATNDVLDDGDLTAPPAVTDSTPVATTDAPSTTAPPAESPEEPTVPVPGITWERQDLDLGIDGIYHVLSLTRLGDRLFSSIYVEGPDRTTGEEQLWTSLDGVSWERVAEAPSGSYLPSSDQLVIVNYREDDSITVSTSQDGFTWASSQLQPEGLTADVPPLRERHFHVQAVVPFEGSMIVMGGIEESLDVDQLAEMLGTTTDGFDSGRFDDNGGSLTFRDGRSISFTWEEVGLDEPGNRSTYSETQVWIGAPGEQLALSPETLPTEWLLAASPSESGLLVVGWSDTSSSWRLAAFHSTDGRRFEPVETFPSASHIRSIGRVGDAWVAIGSPRGANAAAWWSSDGIEYTRSSNSWGFQLSLEALGTGEQLGVITGFTNHTSNTGELASGVWATADGRTWAPRHIPGELLGLHGHPILGAPAVLDDTVYIIGTEFEDMSDGSSDPGTPVLWIGHIEE